MEEAITKSATTYAYEDKAWGDTSDWARLSSADYSLWTSLREGMWDSKVDYLPFEEPNKFIPFNSHIVFNAVNVTHNLSSLLHDELKRAYDTTNLYFYQEVCLMR